MSRAVDRPSRPSLHKSTPPKPGDSAALRKAALRQPLTEREGEGVTLRRECFDDAGDVLPWREILWKWRDAVRDNRDVWATFQNDEGEQITAELTDRFHPDVFEKRYAKLNDLVDGLETEYVDEAMTTVMLSLTASSTDDEGYPRPPVDHLLDLRQSEGAVNTALERALDGYRWERVVLPEQHESGYIHFHWAIIVEGRVEPEDFQPVIDAHLRNCPTADREAHRILPDDPKKSAVSVRNEGESLPAYLMAYTLGDGDEYAHDPLEAPEERQMMLALLWAANARYWRPSDGAQRHMTLPNVTEGEWCMVGLRDGRDGELHELPEDFSGGGVVMIEVDGVPPPRG